MALPAYSPNGPFLLPPQFCGLLPLCPQVGQGQTQPFYQEFLKGQPKTLGTVQITLVILHVALSAVLIVTMYETLSITIISGVTFWGSIFYLISGSLSIAAENKQSRCLVRGSLSINIISCIAALLESSLIIADFNIYFASSCQSYECRPSSYSVLNIRTVSLAFLLIASLLQFSLSLSLAIFGCKSLNHASIQEPQVYVINNNYNTVVTPGQFPPGNDNRNFIPETFIGIVPTNPGKQL
ncbi:membrane-spanning 4-domains subfamily A member 15-like isoform X2 [Bombina bombina]|uniref:membrane-spanning 4-domains subfamily A member 15-like isoform X2 n=1 Tax=Bombina bombina TaxID=8345 RepID=UPI00235AC6DB|nr:membrane-spanning 4-domains subfamily A member 15-like isoform X2 [Bombina bombina]